MLIFCLIGIFLNIAFTRLCFITGLPLYLDTILTITITLSCGLGWGILCGTLTNVLCHSIFGYGWEAYLFTICNIATALITWFFYRFFMQELEGTQELANQNVSKRGLRALQHNSSQLSRIMDRVIILILFSFALCLAMSILGGLIATIIQMIDSAYSDDNGITGVLSATMFGQNAPILLKEIISRIPVNIIDRLISVFAGYGIALLLNKCFKRLNISLRSQA